MENLKCLVENYAETKEALEKYKKLCDGMNADIKVAMSELGTTEVKTPKYTAKLVVQKKESMDEDMLLDILHQKNYTSVIKTREYVDMEALESAIYHGEIDTDTITAMGVCKSVKEVPTLRITKNK